MKTYRVIVRNVHLYELSIDADTEERAKELARLEAMSGNYSPDENYWDVATTQPHPPATGQEK